MPSSHVQFTPTVNLSKRPKVHEDVYQMMPDGNVGIICPPCGMLIAFCTARNAKLGYFVKIRDRKVRYIRELGTWIEEFEERTRPITWMTAVCPACWASWDVQSFMRVDRDTHRLKEAGAPRERKVITARKRRKTPINQQRPRGSSTVEYL